MVSPIFFFSEVLVFNVLYTPSYYALSIQFANKLYLITKKFPVRLFLFTPISLKLSKNGSDSIALTKTSYWLPETTTFNFYLLLLAFTMLFENHRLTLIVAYLKNGHK